MRTLSPRRGFGGGARLAADGYTLALFSTSTAISVSLFKQLPYDPGPRLRAGLDVSTFANVLATGALTRNTPPLPR